MDLQAKAGLQPCALFLIIAPLFGGEFCCATYRSQNRRFLLEAGRVGRYGRLRESTVMIPKIPVQCQRILLLRLRLAGYLMVIYAELVGIITA